MIKEKSVLVLGVGPDQGLGVALCKQFAERKVIRFLVVEEVKRTWMLLRKLKFQKVLLRE